jgi:hypothetical protein
MNYRTYNFFARKNYAADAVIVEDLKLVNPITGIVIGIEGQNTTGTNTEHILACLKKLEIIDGSDVLYSLDGFEADALDWYNREGKFRSNYNFVLGALGQCRYVGINFGRYPGDPELAFDPKKFTNPQIKVTLDLDAGGNTNSSIYVTMWANLFDEKVISPSGFLMAKEIKSWTMASATHEYTDLPLDYPYRAIYFAPRLRGTEPCQCVSNIKISEDQDKRIPYDLDAASMMRNLMEMYPPVEEHYYAGVSSSLGYLYIAPSERVIAQILQWKETSDAIGISAYDGDGGKLKHICSSGSSNVQVYVRGFAPHCVYEIPTGLKHDISDWYNVRALGSLRADITGAAAATGYLFLQQYRTY